MEWWIWLIIAVIVLIIIGVMVGFFWIRSMSENKILKQDIKGLENIKSEIVQSLSDCRKNILECEQKCI
jgi:uncharacterized protein YneF (UPF0154 family)